MTQLQLATSSVFASEAVRLAIPRTVAGNMGMATVLEMAAIREAGTMPFRSTDADHTDIKMDTDTATDMTLCICGIRDQPA